MPTGSLWEDVLISPGNPGSKKPTGADIPAYQAKSPILKMVLQEFIYPMKLGWPVLMHIMQAAKPI